MGLLSDATKFTWILRTFGFFKIPILYWCRPKIIEVNDTCCVIKIPLNRRTRNHERSMYIGALTVGADIAGGVIAMYKVRKSGRKIRLVFKDFHAKYLKRAEGDVVFRCDDGAVLDGVLELAAKTGERQNVPVHIIATVPNKFGEQPVATFVLTLSVKDVTDSKEKLIGVL